MLANEIHNCNLFTLDDILVGKVTISVSLTEIHCPQILEQIHLIELHDWMMLNWIIRYVLGFIIVVSELIIIRKEAPSTLTQIVYTEEIRNNILCTFLLQIEYSKLLTRER